MRQRKIDGLSVVVFILALLVIGSSTATVLLCIHRFVGITEKVFLWYLVGITGPGSVIVTAYVTVCIHKQKNSKLLFWLGKNYPKLTIVWVMMIYTADSLKNTVSWTVEQVYNALSLQWTIFGLSMAIFLVWDGIVGDFLKSKQPRKPDQDDKMEKYKFLLKKQSFSEDVETTFSNIILLTVNLFLLFFSTGSVFLRGCRHAVDVTDAWPEWVARPELGAQVVLLDGFLAMPVDLPVLVFHASPWAGCGCRSRVRPDRG